MKKGRCALSNDENTDWNQKIIEFGEMRKEGV